MPVPESSGGRRARGPLWRAQILWVALVLAGCGEDQPEQIERAEVTSTTARSTTTTSRVTTTTLEPCPSGSTGAPTGQAEQADVDGDGELDAVFAVDGGDGTWDLVVELARGGAPSLELQSFGASFGVVGGADVDGDGTEEVWARTGAGASSTIVGLFRLDGCALEQVAVSAGGPPVELPVGGSVGTASGVECRDERLLVHTATYVDDGSDSYDVATTTYELSDGELTQVSTGVVQVAASDPELLRYTTFSCGDLSL